MIVKEQPSNENYNELISKINSEEENCCAFVGSGLSYSIGYPSWEKLVNIYEESLGLKEGILLKKFEEHEYKYQMAVEEIKSKLSEQEFNEILINEFRERKPNHNSNHKRLVNIDFGGFITTNYDCCIEFAASSLHVPYKIFVCPDLDISFLRMNDKKYIYHLHGLIIPDKPYKHIHSIVISRTDYKVRYKSEETLKSFIYQLFGNHIVVFFGFGLSGDAYLVDLLKTMIKEYEVSRKRDHPNENRKYPNLFFVAHEESINDRLIQDLIHDLNLKPIYFTGIKGDFSNLSRLLEDIEIKTRRTNLLESVASPWVREL